MYSYTIADVEVNWCMEVMCHGLNLSLKEHEALKNCVHVYCEWLVALIPDEAKVGEMIRESRIASSRVPSFYQIAFETRNQR